jgi:Uma2 family endonuclease
MNALAQPKMTVDEFLAWADGREGRWELRDGVVISMSPERAAHGRTKYAAAKSMEAALLRAKLPCYLLLDCVAVRVDARTSFQPDLVIHCGKPVPDEDTEVADPVIVVEVLSPSTRNIDLGLKMRRYFELASIQHYLILDPDDRYAIHYARGEGDTLLTRIVSEGALRFDPPGFTVEARSLFPEPYEG